MGLVRDVSPFHLRDLNFGDGLAGCLVCGFLFGLGVVFCCLVACLVCFPHGRDLLFLLNCVRIVCNLERPSELSWRARHGRKKKGVFQVSVEGHWTYSRTYVLVLQVSLRLFNLDCRYPRDLLQPASKKKVLYCGLMRQDCEHPLRGIDPKRETF